jgi:glycosyltransferase involved in cell wall biosynthesis
VPRVRRLTLPENARVPAGGPRIAVITPYYAESLEVLRQGHDSVLIQDVEASVDHFFIADGFRKPELDRWKASNIALPVAHRNNGNTPRAVGTLLAAAEGYDFIAFLDGDNWYHKNHLSSLLRTHQTTKALVCCSWRTFHRLDGTMISNIQDKEDLSFRLVDTSCYLVHRRAFSINLVWSQMPDELSAICDRVFHGAALHKLGNLGFSEEATVAFRTDYPDHYTAVNEIPPASGVAKIEKINMAAAYLRSSQGVTTCVTQLGFWPGTYIFR